MGVKFSKDAMRRLSRQMRIGAWVGSAALGSATVFSNNFWNMFFGGALWLVMQLLATLIEMLEF